MRKCGSFTVCAADWMTLNQSFICAKECKSNRRGRFDIILIFMYITAILRKRNNSNEGDSFLCNQSGVFGRVIGIVTTFPCKETAFPIVMHVLWNTSSRPIDYHFFRQFGCLFLLCWSFYYFKETKEKARKLVEYRMLVRELYQQQ